MAHIGALLGRGTYRAWHILGVAHIGRGTYRAWHIIGCGTYRMWHIGRGTYGGKVSLTYESSSPFL